jgi:hypothetical protein
LCCSIACKPRCLRFITKKMLLKNRNCFRHVCLPVVQRLRFEAESGLQVRPLWELRQKGPMALCPS